MASAKSVTPVGAVRDAWGRSLTLSHSPPHTAREPRRPRATGELGWRRAAGGCAQGARSQTPRWVMGAEGWEARLGICF